MPVYILNQKFRAVPQTTAGDEAASGPSVRPPSDRQVRLAEMFGLGLDETHEVTLYDGLALNVRSGDVVFITGPSGSGKSVLLRALVRAIRDACPAGGHVVDLAHLHLPTDRPAVDLPNGSLETALRRLSAAGLADAMALLRPASQLSDGQRYRLRLALALNRLLETPGATDCSPIGAPRDAEGNAPTGEAQAPANEDDRPLPRPARARAGRGTRFDKQTMAPGTPSRVLVADEFCSTLDRCCARAVAYRVRRLADQSRTGPSAGGLTVLAASAHDDLVQDLAPDVLVVKQEGAGVEVHYAEATRNKPLTGGQAASGTRAPVEEDTP